MGTRNLTMVIEGEKTRIAQYGQWDGYPGGQGATALEFLRAVDINEFKVRVGQLRFFTEEELDEMDKNGKPFESRPWLSRDLGAEILYAVGRGEFTGNNYPNGKKKVSVTVDGLIDQSDFAADSLFCEWAYVIDLDKNTFEVYKGFNTSPLEPGERFKDLAREGEYYPVRLAAKWPLDKLPTEAKFLSEFEGEE